MCKNPLDTPSYKAWCKEAKERNKVLVEPKPESAQLSQEHGNHQLSEVGNETKTV